MACANEQLKHVLKLASQLVVLVPLQPQRGAAGAGAVSDSRSSAHQMMAIYWCFETVCHYVHV